VDLCSESPVESREEGLRSLQEKKKREQKNSQGKMLQWKRKEEAVRPRRQSRRRRRTKVERILIENMILIFLQTQGLTRRNYNEGSSGRRSLLRYAER
jgi:hypothetical protein